MLPLQPITCLGRPEADLKKALGRLVGGLWGWEPPSAKEGAFFREASKKCLAIDQTNLGRFLELYVGRRRFAWLIFKMFQTFH